MGVLSRRPDWLNLLARSSNSDYWTKLPELSNQPFFKSNGTNTEKIEHASQTVVDAVDGQLVQSKRSQKQDRLTPISLHGSGGPQLRDPVHVLGRASGRDQEENVEPRRRGHKHRMLEPEQRRRGHYPQDDR